MKLSLNSCKCASAILLTLTITAAIILAAAPQDLMAGTPESAIQSAYSPEQATPGGGTSSDTSSGTSSGIPVQTTTVPAIATAGTAAPKVISGVVTSLAPDTTPPTIFNQTPANGSVTGSSVFLSANYSDPEPSSGIKPTTAMIHVDNRHQVGTTITDSGISILRSGLTDGTHKIEAFICDNVYNCSVSTWYINVDATAPTASGMQPTGSINTSSSTISATLSDGSGSGVNTGGVTTSLDGVNISSGCSIIASRLNCVTGALSDGDHNVSIDIPDNVGNHGTAIWSFHVDTASIGVTGQLPAPASWQTTATQQIGANFQAAGIGVISSGTVQLLVDGVEVTSEASIDASGVRYTPGAFSEGNHTVRVTAWDDAGHSGQSEWNFNVDTIAPDISQETPRGITDSGMPSISAHYADDGSGIDTASVRVLLNGDDVTSSATVGGSDITYTPGSTLPSGANNIQVSVADHAGNNQTSTWSINVPAPVFQQPVTPSPGQTSRTIRLVQYWQSYSPLSIGGSGGGWAITGFTASPNSYFLPWYDSRSDGGGRKSELVMANRGGGEASVSVFVGGQEKWHGVLAEGAGEIRELADTTGGPVKIVCPTGQQLDVSLRTTRGSFISEVRAVAGEDLEPVWLLPWYAPQTGNNSGSNNLLIGNTGTEEAAVDVYIGDPDLPESLKGHYSIQAGTAAIADLKDAESGLVRVVSTNGQPLIVGVQTMTGDSFSELAAAGLSRLDSRYSFDSYDSRPESGVQGDWILLGNGLNEEARVEISIGGRKMNDPENPGNDFFLLPKGGARELQFHDTTGSPVEVTCTNCSFGQGFVAAHRVIKNQSISEEMGRPSPLMPYGDLSQD